MDGSAVPGAGCLGTLFAFAIIGAVVTVVGLIWGVIWLLNHLAWVP